MTEPGKQKLNVVGSAVRILLGGEQTGGAFAIVEDITPPGGGPPPHVHSREDEAFVVLEGQIEVLLRDRWVPVPVGTCALAPRGVPHTYRNAGTTPTRMVVTISPAGFERFFVEVDRMSASGPPTPEKLIELGAKFGLEFLPPG